MPVLGPEHLMLIAIPTGVDAETVMRLSMQNGATGAEIIALATTVIGEENNAIVNKYGGIVNITESVYARYRNGTGTRTMTPTKAEYVQNDPVHAEQIGNMLPYQAFEDAVGWSADYLESADRSRLVFDLEEIRDRWRNRVDYDVIKRMLSKAENRIGSGGYDVPWVSGTGGSVDYTPIQYGGNVFQDTHTHFGRINSAISTTHTVTALNDMAKHLSEHGHLGRKVAYVSQSDVAYYTGMASNRFAALVPGEFRVGSGNTAFGMVAQGETTGLPGELFGYFNSDWGIVELRYHERIPATYLAMFKSYGFNNTKNPLAIRTSKKGFGMTVVPQVNNNMMPELDHIRFKGGHGVGVNDRTNGVAWQIATGGSSYDEPTIS